jgi:anti-sigma factor RsiW
MTRSSDTPPTAEHLTPSTLEGYRNHTLAPAALLAADDHIAVCPACREAALNAEAEPDSDAYANFSLADLFGDSANADFAEDTHLSYEQMEGYIESKLDEIDREIVEGHLVTCDACVEEVRDLRAFRAERSTYPAQSYEPAPQRSFWDRLFAPLDKIPSGGRVGLQLAAAAIAGVAIVTSTTLPLRNQIAQLSAQSNEQKQQNAQQLAQLQEQLKRAEAASQLAKGETEAQQKAAQDAQKTIQALKTQVAALQTKVASPDPNSATPTINPTPRPQTGPVTSSPLVASLKSGDEKVTVRRDGTVTGLPAGISSRVQGTVVAALTKGSFPIAASVQGLIGEKGTLLSNNGSEGATQRLFGPVGTRVLSARPVFRWSAVPGAVGYQIAVYDAADFSKVAESPVLTKTAWQASTDLPRGKTLLWQVTTTFSEESEREPLLTPAPPAPEARFVALSETEAQAVSAQTAKAADSPLARAAVYAEAGLLDDAERELDTLIAANPKEPLVRKLRDSLRKLPKE